MKLPVFPAFQPAFFAAVSFPLSSPLQFFDELVDNLSFFSEYQFMDPHPDQDDGGDHGADSDDADVDEGHDEDDDFGSDPSYECVDHFTCTPCNNHSTCRPNNPESLRSTVHIQ